MSVGAPQDKNAIDARAYTLSVQVRDILAAVGNLKVFLDTKIDSELTALGYTASEVTLLRASLTDLDNLRKVATGLQAQTPASNFLFNSNKLVGPN